MTTQAPSAGPSNAGLILKGALANEVPQAVAWGVAFAVAVAWPLVVFRYPPFQDLPNHLARVFILLHQDDPLLAAHFVVDWKLIPDLAWDVFGVVVGRVLPLDITLKAFIFLSLGLTVLGVFLLNRALVGRWTWLPLLVMPFLFNTGLTKGFLGFNFSVGFALLAAAWWAANPEGHWRRRLAVATALSTALFFAHLLAWGCYGLFVLGPKLAELVPTLRRDGARALPGWLLRLARDGLQAVPPLALLGFGMLGGGGGFHLAGRVAEFDPPFIRLSKLSHVIDVGTLVPAVYFLIVCGVLALSLLAIRQARLVGPALFALPLLAIAFLVVPDELYATHMIAWRIGLFIVFLLLASARPAPSIFQPLTRGILSVFLVATLGLSTWQAYSAVNSDAGRQQFLDLIQRIPAGDTLFMEHELVDSPSLEYDRLGLYHVGAFAVLDRKIMVQSLFANPAQQPISYRQQAFANVTVNGRVFLEDLAANLKSQGLSLSDHIHSFNWLVIHGPRPDADAQYLPLTGFAAVSQNGQFRLYCKTHADASQEGGVLCPDNLVP